MLVSKKFTCETYVPSEGTKFEKEYVMRQGKKVDVDAWIQAGREDTEIYATLEKYGCLDRMQLNTEGVYADLTNLPNLRGALEQEIEAQRIWDNDIPLEIKKEFNMDKHEFMDRGAEWLKNRMEAEKPVEQPTPTTNEEPKGE